MSDANRAYDLRAWLERADKLGQLKRVEGADAHLEIGAITELNAKTQDGPALLFDRIGGYPDGFRVLTGDLLNPVAVGMTMGMRPYRSARPDDHTRRGAGQQALQHQGNHQRMHSLRPTRQQYVSSGRPICPGHSEGRQAEVGAALRPLMSEMLSPMIVLVMDLFHQ